MTKTTEIVKFNVGGQRYEVSRSLLSLYPNTMISKSTSESWLQDPKQEIFIDRDGTMFGQVLIFLRDGRVDLPRVVNRKAFLNELVYYGLDEVDESVIEDEFYRSNAASNLNLRETRIIYTIVQCIIDHFLSFGTPSTRSNNLCLNDKEKTDFRALLNGTTSDVVSKLNVHLHKVGLEVLSITSGHLCIVYKAL